MWVWEPDHWIPTPALTLLRQMISGKLFHLPVPHSAHFYPWWLSGKEFACQCRRCEFNPWVREISG